MKKTSSLIKDDIFSAIDIARLVTMSPEHMRKEIRRILKKKFWDGYRPFRGALKYMLGEPLPLFPEQQREPWPTIAQRIKNASSRKSEANINLAAGEPFYFHCEKHNVVAKSRDFSPLRLGRGMKKVFWDPYIVKYDGEPTVSFSDPRSGKHLHEGARRVVFSLIHEGVRVRYQDYENVRLCIVRLHKGRDKARHVRVHFAEGIELFPMDYLERKIDEIFTALDEVRREIAEEAAQEITEEKKRRSSG